MRSAFCWQADKGERLWPLTRDRAKPAVPFGGVYRIIDITLSNCINSDLRRVFVLTQYKALSLNRHIRQGWSQLAGPRRIHRSAAAADARLHQLVSGHRRRRLPEYLFDRQRALALRHHSFRRSHLQDELPEDAAAARGFRRRRHCGHIRSSPRRRPPGASA